MLQSVQYPNIYATASAIRKKYGYASIQTHNNVQNSAWIMQNLHSLSLPDVALVVEYNRDPNVRVKIMERIHDIKSSIGHIPDLKDISKLKQSPV